MRPNWRGAGINGEKIALPGLREALSILTIGVQDWIDFPSITAGASAGIAIGAKQILRRIGPNRDQGLLATIGRFPGMRNSKFHAGKLHRSAANMFFFDK